MPVELTDNENRLLERAASELVNKAEAELEVTLSNQEKVDIITELNRLAREQIDELVHSHNAAQRPYEFFEVLRGFVFKFGVWRPLYGLQTLAWYLVVILGFVMAISLLFALVAYGVLRLF